VRTRGGITAFMLILSPLAAACAARAPHAAVVSPGQPPAPAVSTPSVAEGPALAPPIVKDVVLEGVTAFRPVMVYRAIVLRPGGQLRRDPSTYAADLERRYQAHGYFAARVEAAWDPASAVLTLRVEEGRLREVTVTGIDGGAADKARTLLGLALGKVVTEKELHAGLHRLEDGSGGALRLAGDPGYAVDPVPDGVRLQIAVSTVATRLRVRLQGPDLSPLHNRVEGTAPGAGLELTVFDPAGLQHARVYAHAAYGFTSRDPRFAVGAERPFAGRHFLLGYEFHDLTDTDDFFRRYPVEFTAGVPHTFEITEDYFRRRGHEAYAFLRPSPRIHVGVSFRHDRFESLPVIAKDSIWFFSRRARLNPEVEEGTRNSVLLTARWAAGAPLYATPAAELDSYLLRDPYGDRLRYEQSVRADATYEIAGRATPDGLSYRRFIGHLRARRDLTSIFSVDGRVLVGLGHDLPFQRRFALGGAGTLRGYGLKTFAGDDVVLSTVEARVRPSFRWPDLIAFYDGGAAWTTGLTGAGWRDDVGVGLEWRGAGPIGFRLDGAYALRPLPGQDRSRMYASLVLPF
jgi:Omp85 superfamily domain/Surface antigen variable number repeat